MKKTFFWGFLFIVIGIFCIGCESHKQPTDSLAHNGAEAESEDSGTIDGIEWELKDGVLTIRGEGALRETPWSENVDRIQKVIIAAVGDSNSLFTRYHKLPGILCFVTSVCRRPRSRHSITWSATLMSCCVLQFLM